MTSLACGEIILTSGCGSSAAAEAIMGDAMTHMTSRAANALILIPSHPKKGKRMLVYKITEVD